MKEKKEKKEKKVLTPEEKKKRNRRIRRIIFAVLAGVIVLYFVVSARIAASMPMVVETRAAEIGDIEQVVTVNGTVASDETRVFYAELNAQVAELSVRVGDAVAEGDVLMTYDQEDIDHNIREAELNARITTGDYNDTMERAYEAMRRYGISGMNRAQLQQVVDMINAQVTVLTEKIREKRERMSRTRQELEWTRRDVDQNGTLDEMQEGFNPQDHTDLYYDIDEAIQGIVWALEYDPEILGWDKNITELNELKAKVEEVLASLPTGGAQDRLQANQELNRMNTEDTLERLTEAGEGLVAAFDGVVTDVKAVEGMTVAAGTELFTVASTESVHVNVTLTRYDLEKVQEGQQATVTIAGREYRGRVSRIAHNAVTNERGGTVVRAEIKILNPDEHVFLGLEASVGIHTAEKKDTLLVPVEAINTDIEGTFVYVLEDGVIARKDVEAGIATDLYQEVTQGLADGDQVLTNITGEITEGMNAVSLTALSTETTE